MISYVPAGTFAGDLMYASFVDKELWRVVIDPADATILYRVDELGRTGAGALERGGGAVA